MEKTLGLQCPPLVVQSHRCPRTPVGWEGHWDCSVPLWWYNPMDVPRTPMGHGTGKDIEIAVSPFGGTIPWMSLGLPWDTGQEGHWDCSVPCGGAIP